jgi:uncharacterized protein involved in exopolysaccharide biosynthesis
MIHADTIGQNEAALPETQAEYSALDFMILLARRKRFILRFTLGATLLAVVISLIMPNWYSATAIVLPPAQSSSLSSALLGQLSGRGSALASLAGGGLGLKSPGEMYVSFFRSRTVEDSLIQRFGLMNRYGSKRMSDARKSFESHSSVVLGAKDGLISVKVEDKDPKVAADIANGYVDEFKKLSATLAFTEASQRRLFFQQQLQEARGKLTDAEEAMKRMEVSTGVLQVDSQAKALLEAAASLRGQAVAKEIQIQSMRSFATEDNPELVVAKRQLAEIQAQLDKLAGKDSDEFIVSKGRAPEAGMEYLRKLRDLKYYEAIYELIAKQFELAKLDEARQGAVIQVPEEAVAPDRKSFPPRSVIVVLAMIVGFMTAACWVLISEGIARAKQDSKQARRIQTLHDLLVAKR